jgi:adenosine/AMP kinase
MNQYAHNDSIMANDQSLHNFHQRSFLQLAALFLIFSSSCFAINLLLLILSDVQFVFSLFSHVMKAGTE